MPELDLTAEVITHRSSLRSRAVLLGWHPATKLEMDPEQRATKRGRCGSVEHVDGEETMAGVRGWFEQELAARVPAARLLCST